MATELTIPDNETGGFLSIIESMVSNPKVDVSKLEKMLDMQERILAKQAEMSFNAAMSRLQPKMPLIQQKTDGHNKKYASYEDIDKAIRPLYTAEGFSISFDTTQNGTQITVEGTLSHKDGHSRKASMVLPSDTSGGKNAIQAVGSTISYGKRYALCMLLNIVTTGEDTDAKTFIDTAAAADIDNRLNALKDPAAAKKGFLKFMGVENLQEISTKDYLKAMNAIKAKEKQNARA